MYEGVSFLSNMQEPKKEDPAEKKVKVEVKKERRKKLESDIPSVQIYQSPGTTLVVIGRYNYKVCCCYCWFFSNLGLTLPWSPKFG